MQLDMSEISRNYEQSRKGREVNKWIFSILTFGLGALYLWATTTVIKKGEIGLRCDARGNMHLLPPGRHSNFPWESYPVDPIPLWEKIIKLGPYQIINVQRGYVAKTFNKGELEILDVGQHLLMDASHVFDGFIPVKQETKKLDEVTAYTRDNVGLTLHADVRYQIEDPNKAVQQISDIETSIREIAEISISQIVGNHNLADFAPATSNVNIENHGMGAVLQELTRKITDQLASLGIKLLNIGITSWKINDDDLAHELAQGAVIQSQVQSKMISAKREAEIKIIAAEAEAKSMEIRATGEAKAIGLRGKAIKELAEQFKEDPIAQSIYERSQQIELVHGANNPYLFFMPPSADTKHLPKFTLPLERSNTLS